MKTKYLILICCVSLLLAMAGIVGSGNVALTTGDPNTDLSNANKYPLALRTDTWVLYKFNGSTFIETGGADNLGNHTATENINFNNFKGISLAPGAAGTDAVNKDQLDAIVPSNVFTDYTTGNNTHTPTLSKGVDIVRVGVNVDTVFLSASSISRKVVRVYYQTPGNATMGENIPIVYGSSQVSYLSMGQTKEFVANGTSYLINTLSTPEHTYETTVDVTDGVIDTIYPKLGVTYLVDAATASGDVTIRIFNDDPGTFSTGTDIFLLQKEHFYVKLFGGQTNSVTFEVIEGGAVIGRLYYDTVASSASETFTDNYKSLKFVKYLNNGADSGFRIYD